MNFNLMKHIPNAVTLKVGRTILLSKKNSPAILFGVGVVGIIATAVLAARGTLKLEEVIDTAERSVDRAKVVHASDKDSSEMDYKKDLIVVYAKCVGSITKLYGPSIVVGVLTIGSLAGSHNILSRRNAGLMAAYAALDKGFNEYRQRVLEEVGPEKEREFRYGSELQEVTETTDNGSNVKTVVRAKSGLPSVYARWFDNTNKEWVRRNEYNRLFLNLQQRYANDILHARGHLFLNEVYDMLGMEPTKAGQVVGWIISQDTDSFVDFGLYDSENPQARAFVNGTDGAILLDFNVEVIYDKIGKDV